MKVKDCTKTNTIHYHGSLFVYEWTLLTDDNTTLHLDTINDYKKEDIIGGYISVDGDLFTAKK